MTPASAAPVNDNRANAIALQLGVGNTIGNVDASIEAGETLTPNDPLGQRCGNADGVNLAKGVQLDRSLWWEFAGTGGPVTVSSDESNINLDTVLVVYDMPTGDVLGCSDDLQPHDPARPNFPGMRVNSEMTIDTVAGRAYLAQLGGCTAPQSPLVCGQTTGGNITIRVSGTPPNDRRSDAATITAGSPITMTNTGATLEPGEVQTCGASPFAKTIWFRYRAPAVGHATFSVAGTDKSLDTVLDVYRGDASAPLGCNDDAVANTFGGSSLPGIQPAGAPVIVGPGEYLIQVGGFHGPGFSAVAAYHGRLTVQVQFVEDVDLDDDGVHRDADCDDASPGTRPGAQEVVNNDVDENCDGIIAFDHDGDGSLAAPAGSDCNDSNAAIRPGIPDVPDNRIDDNCDGADTTTPPKPAPRIDADYQFSRGSRSGLVTTFAVVGGNGSSFPVGTRITLRCRGKHCHRRASLQRRLVKRSYRRLSLMRELRLSLRRRTTQPVLRPGTTVEVRVTKPGHVGYRMVVRITSRGPRYEETCLTTTGKPRTRC